MNEYVQLPVGSTLQGGKYRIIRVLGQGGFGITYLAEQTGLGMKVAIKEFFLKGTCQRDSTTSYVSVPVTDNRELVSKCLKKFRSEARKIASLNNDHIVSIIDIFDENGTSYYVMKHLSGGSLSDRISSGALSEEAALKIICEISDALGSIHSNGLLHLDVKPANILFDDRNRAVLIDFGVSKYVDSEKDTTTTSSLVGFSRGFAPLEQINAIVSSLTPATDIYALGATLYNLVVGVTPPDATIVMDSGLPPMPDVISKEVKNAITRCMQPRKKDRPQNVETFLRMLPEKSVPVDNDEVTIISAGSLSNKIANPKEKESSTVVKENLERLLEDVKRQNKEEEEKRRLAEEKAKEEERKRIEAEKAAADERRLLEEEKKRLEEEKKLQQELAQKKAEEERIKKEEEEQNRRQAEEKAEEEKQKRIAAEKIAAEENKRHEEEKKRLEEERKRLEEEKKILEEERKRIEEEKKQQQELIRQKAEEEKLKREKEDQERRLAEEKAEGERKQRLAAVKAAEEEKKRLEEERKQLEEDRARLAAERKEQEELARQKAEEEKIKKEKEAQEKRLAEEKAEAERKERVAAVKAAEEEKKRLEEERKRLEEEKKRQEEEKKRESLLSKEEVASLKSEDTEMVEERKPLKVSPRYLAYALLGILAIGICIWLFKPKKDRGNIDKPQEPETVVVDTISTEKQDTVIVPVESPKESPEPIIHVSGISLNKKALTIPVGSKETLKASVAPSNATDKSYYWTSSDKSIATVYAGVVTAKTEGITTITVTTKDGRKTDSCTITVEKGLKEEEKVESEITEAIEKKDYTTLEGFADNGNARARKALADHYIQVAEVNSKSNDLSKLRISYNYAAKLYSWGYRNEALKISKALSDKGFYDFNDYGIQKPNW